MKATLLAALVLAITAVLVAVCTSRTGRLPDAASLKIGSPTSTGALEEQSDSELVLDAKMSPEIKDRMAIETESPSVATAPAKEPAKANAQLPKTGPEYWEELYAGATYGQIIDAQRELTFALNDMTKDYYQREFEQGRYDVSFPVPNERGEYQVPYSDEWLSNVRVLPTGEMQTVRLPKEGNEKAYEIREHILWLAERETKLKKQPR